MEQENLLALEIRPRMTAHVHKPNAHARMSYYKTGPIPGTPGA
eukprot:CAMPEP_0177427648 /NCGR_PEP_ID=MMETSP0368-20130122/74163_1 /TAXON_ID=447022 ORGANISM="Scrippsiella hangoei-like, Strain SHHI-4" /NCGR_SAMPLE_ID=MMETSP0368 /ASSEMBLY_ACC=CAM_ASM_000363 /LENGTH=42 /DNA_ID= /DNA_START= /DNA_END= /DNA_ORIENTATION=